MKKQNVSMHFSNWTFSFWNQFKQIEVFPLFQTILDSWETSSKLVWSKTITWFRQKTFFNYQLCSKGTFLLYLNKI